MNHLKKFNEKFGILKSLEDQVDKYFEIIQQNINKNKFEFIYNLDNDNYKFKLIIDKNSKDSGQFTFNKNTKEMTIHLKLRNDKSTLLHEVKHLDFSLRKKNWNNTLFRNTNNILSRSNKKSFVIAKELFYLIDENEFQARYHGYYTNIDKYIKDNISQNPKSYEISFLFYDYLINFSNDKSYTFYMYKKEFKFEDFLSNKDINLLFYSLIGNEFSLDLLKYTFNKLSGLYKKTFNAYTKEDIKNINLLKNKYEKLINIQLRKYNRKFNKLLYLMVDKYVQ